jgi:hypothetical protein
VHDTVVCPTGNVEPDGGVHVTSTLPLTRSVAVAVNETAAPEALVAVTVMSAGSVSTAGVVSRTVTTAMDEALDTRVEGGQVPPAEIQCDERLGGFALPALAAG